MSSENAVFEELQKEIDKEVEKAKNDLSRVIRSQITETITSRIKTAVQSATGLERDWGSARDGWRIWRTNGVENPITRMIQQTAETRVREWLEKNAHKLEGFTTSQESTIIKDYRSALSYHGKRAAQALGERRAKEMVEAAVAKPFALIERDKLALEIEELQARKAELEQEAELAQQAQGG